MRYPFKLVTVTTIVLCLITATAFADTYLEFTQADVDKAIKAKDTEQLLAYCQHNANLDAAWKSACMAVLHEYEATGNADALMRICNNEEKAWHTDYYAPACEAGTRLRSGAYKKALADCGKLKETYAKYEVGLPKDAADELFMAVGMRAAECKAWDLLWVDFFHQDDRGPALMRKIAATGAALDAQLMTYLAANKDHPFAFENGGYALGHTLAWVQEANKVGKCERFIPYAKKASQETLGTWLSFFADTTCKAAKPLAVARLSSKIADQRRQACAVIGKLGAKGDIAKLKILAKLDPEYKVEDMVRIYWVRDACNAAIGEIQLH